MTGSTPVRSTYKALETSALLITRPKKRANTSKLYTEFLKEKRSVMQSLLVPYEKCRIYKGHSYWYVEYKYRNPQTRNLDRFKEYFGVNYIKDATEKQIYAEEIAKFIDENLKQGFNPFEQLVIKQQGKSTLGVLNTLWLFR